MYVYSHVQSISLDAVPGFPSIAIRLREGRCNTFEMVRLDFFYISYIYVYTYTCICIYFHVQARCLDWVLFRL